MNKQKAEYLERLIAEMEKDKIKSTVGTLERMLEKMEEDKLKCTGDELIMVTYGANLIKMMLENLASSK